MVIEKQKYPSTVNLFKSNSFTFKNEYVNVSESFAGKDFFLEHP